MTIHDLRIGRLDEAATRILQIASAAAVEAGTAVAGQLSIVALLVGDVELVGGVPVEVDTAACDPAIVVVDDGLVEVVPAILAALLGCLRNVLRVPCRPERAQGHHVRIDILLGNHAADGQARYWRCTVDGTYVSQAAVAKDGIARIAVVVRDVIAPGTFAIGLPIGVTAS